MADFVAIQPLGSYSNIDIAIGPIPTSGGFIQAASGVAAGTAVLVGVTIFAASSASAAGLTVQDTQGNSYTLLGQHSDGTNLLAVYGAILANFLTEQDTISWSTTSDFTQAGIAFASNNTSLTVDFANTGTSSATSGAINATYGDVVLGFTAFTVVGLATPAGPGTWDNPLIVYNTSERVTPSIEGIGVFAGETFVAGGGGPVTYNPTVSGGTPFATIVVGLRQQPITGAWASTELTDVQYFGGYPEAWPEIPSRGPFFFTYVDNDKVQFDPALHSRMDEDIFSLEIQHDEGQVPVLTLIIKNPRVGLLAPSRKQWAYLAYQHSESSAIIPLFFGVLVGIPSDFFAELITLKFMARGAQYIEQKQAVAETLKTAPNYDPVFLDEAHRDDPDAILEGWSSLYHVDRVTLDVTASDIITGEDGTIEFDESMAPLYDSVKMSLGDCPLDTIQIQANVKWTQRCIGYMPGPAANIVSYTGGSFKSDWPKPGASLGGGWKVEDSYVFDVLDTDHARTYTVSSNWRNQDPSASDCSTATMSYNATYSLWPGISVEGAGSRFSQSGVCDPTGFATVSSTTPGVNIPAKMSTNGTLALEWILNCSWDLRYDARRDFSEFLVMNVTANLQQTLTSPTVDQNTELIKVDGADVGLPVITPEAWSDFVDQVVPVATVIFPNDPTTPGGTSYQIAIQEGVAGSQEPVFSDVPGTITIDGSVQWASLGESPPEDQPEWTSATPVAAGEIYQIEPKQFNLTTGDMETTGASYFFLCLTPGTTNGNYTSFEYLPAITSNDDTPAQPVPFSVILGPGDSASGNIGGESGNSTGASIPAVGGTTQDGSVVWINLGTTPPILPIPIGGTMTNVVGRNYFSTDRGQQSIEYLICKARARLRYRARCVKVEWDAPFENCIGLSCRMNAILDDARLPGGVAEGKVISYTLTADKDGKFIGHVVIGVAVGNGGHVGSVEGKPEYTAATGYCLPGYQAFDGVQTALPNGDIAYTVPTFQAFDDGLAFPLQSFPGTLTITHPIQSAQLATALAQAQSPQLGNVPAVQQAIFHPNNPGSQLTILQNESAVDWLTGGEGTFLIECDPVAAEVLIQPVTNGPFNGSYFIETTPLEIFQGIDLTAESSP